MSAAALVTGATGLIGRYVVDRLLAESSNVRVLVRNDRRVPEEWRGRVECIRGDLREPTSITRAIRDVDTVYHLAALARAWSPDPLGFATINVRAVGELLSAASAAGVRRVVHVSTILTLPPWQRAPLKGKALEPTPYESTKGDGERLVERFVTSGGDAVIVHPTRVYGPGPLSDANGVVLAVRLHLTGRMPFVLDDGEVLANYVHADDVAQVIILAGRRGCPGAHYIAGGENASWRQVLELARRLAGVPARTIRVPPRLVLAAAWLAESWGRLGGVPTLTRGWVRSFLEDRRVELGPTVAALGYAPRPLAVGLEDTIAWMYRERLLGRP